MDQDEGGSVPGPRGYRRTLRAAKAAPVRNGVTAITRGNLRREILSLQGTCIKFQTCSIKVDVKHLLKISVK